MMDEFMLTTERHVAKDRPSDGHDGGGERFVAVEHLLPLLGEQRGGSFEESWGGGEGLGESLACDIVSDCFGRSTRKTS